jgi:flagella basal body P-ring formation protein FlgA
VSASSARSTRIAVALTTVLGLSAVARADPPSLDRAALPQSSADLTPALAVRVAPLLPAGYRLDGVTLGCVPPTRATVQDVAPGVTQLNGRSLVIVLRNGDHTIACSATVAAQRQVLVAAHDLAAGDPVAAADVQPQWVDAFTGAPNALDQLPRTDLVATGTIRAGQPLYAWQLIRPVAFRPGDLVTVMIVNGPVTLRAILEANSTAAVGESATVINPDTGTPVGFTVTGPKTAELVMP